MSVAANLQNISGSSLTAPDEDMELGSDYGLENDHQEDDFDIDLDSDVEQPDEDLVLGDARSDAGIERLDHNNDDIMLDEETEHAEDKSMQDNITIIDEHLSDAGEIGQEDASSYNLPSKNPTDDDIIDYLDDEDVTSGQPNIDFPVESAQVPASPEQPSLVQPDNVPSALPEAVQDEVVVSQSPAPALKKSPSPHAPSAEEVPPYTSEETEQISAQDHDPQASSQNQMSQQCPYTTGTPPVDPVVTSIVIEEDGNVESDAQEAVDDSTANDGHSEPVENTGNEQPPLHPVIMYWQSSEMSLFPAEDATFLLQDESLGYETLDMLLQACRKQLGDTVGEGDELILEAPSLGLSIGDDSVDCSGQRLSDILDVYTLLHQQDGNDHPAPLYVNLYTNTRFSYRLNQLREAACDGKGISQLTFLENFEEDNEEYHENEKQDGSLGNEEQEAVTGDRQNDFAENETFTEGHGDQDEHYYDSTYPEQEEDHTTAFDETTSKTHEVPHEHIDGDDNSSRNTLTEEAKPEVDASVSEEHDTQSAIQEQPEEDDLIDYSDEEPEADTGSVEHAPSSGSSTVQGDATNSQDKTASNTGDAEGKEFIHSASLGETENEPQLPNEGIGATDAQVAEYLEYPQSNFDQAGYEQYDQEHEQSNFDEYVEVSFEQEINENYDQGYDQYDSTKDQLETLVQDEATEAHRYEHSQDYNANINAGVAEVPEASTEANADPEGGESDDAESMNAPVQTEPDDASANVIEPAEEANPEDDPDYIDFGDDDDDDVSHEATTPSHPTEPQRSASSGTKRSRDEEEDGMGQLSSPADAKRVKSR